MMRRVVIMIALVGAVACERAQPAAEENAEHAARDTDSPIAADSAGAPAAAAPATTVDSVRVAVERLVRGDGGPTTWFSAQTAGIVREVGFDPRSRGATVDFVDLRSIIPNASSSAGSEALLRELNAAVFSVGGVDWVQYGMDGDCELFGEWLQYGECIVATREGFTPS
jgi:hypothetical protein